MKALKIIGVVLVVVVALVALLVAVALLPSVQTWAVRKAVAGRPGMKLEVNRVAAGLSAADIQNLHLVKDGMVITAKRVTAKYSAWDYLTKKTLTVDDLAVEDLVLDLREPAKTEEKPKPAEPDKPFRGVLAQAQLPMNVRIARFGIPGKALLPNQQTATFEVRGSDITTGQRGAVDWKAELVNAGANAPFRTARASGTINVHITTERRIDVAEVNAVASVEGPNLPTDQIRLDAKAEQPAAGGNEGYTAKVSLIRGSNTEQLMTLAGQYNAAAAEVTGAWNIAVRTQQLAALLSGLGLPEIAMEGAGKFSAQPDKKVARSSGDLRSDITHLEKFSPDLATIGSLRVQTRFDGGLSNNVAQLEQFALEATTANGRKLADIKTLQRVGYSLNDKRVSFADAKAELARITIEGLPLAWAQPFAKGVTIDSGDLSAVLSVSAEADGSRVRLTTVQPVLLKNVTAHNGQQKLVEQLTLSVKPQVEYAPERVHAELNDFSVTMPIGDAVNGRFTADITSLTKSPVIAFTTDTQAKFVALLKPYVNVDTGPLTVVTQSEGTLDNNVLHFKRSTTRVSRTGGALLLAADLQQQVAINLQNNAITTAKPDAEALRVQLGEVPLAWAEAFVPNAKIAGQVAGGTIAVVLRSVDDIAANATQPITIRGIGVAMNGKPMLQDVDVTVDFTAAKKGQVARYDVRKVEARQGNATLLSLAVAGEAGLGAKPTLSAKGKLSADLAVLSQQPATAASASLARGNVDATFDTKITDTIQAEAMVTAKNLVAKQGNRPLGEAELRVSAAVQPDGSSVLKVPFVFTNQDRKSDLLIDGRLARTGNAITFNGRVSSTLLVVDDLQALSALAPASPATANTPPPNTTAKPSTTAQRTTGQILATVPLPTTQPAAPVTPDKQAFWSAAGGRIELDLKQVNYGKAYVIRGIRGVANISPALLALENLEGQFQQNPFKLVARIDFAANQPQPYTLAATANVTNFDVGALLQAANPQEKPQLETSVTVNMKLNGKGATAANLGLNTYGVFDVTGSQGVLRALGRKGGEAASIGSGLLGVAGAFMKNQNQAADVGAASELAAMLAEMRFDKFVMHVERGADLNLQIGHIEFLSPETRIVGSGGITNQPGVPIEQQPMKVTLSLAGKEGMAHVMNRLHLLGGKQDELGYYTMGTSFTLSGSASKPDSKDLWRIVGEAAAKAILGSGLLGR